MHLKLRVAPNAHLSHVLSLGLHGLLKFLFDFILLPGVVDNVPHDFGLTLEQLVSGVDVRQDEFVYCNRATIVDVYLVEDFIYHFTSHLFIKYLLPSLT